MGLLQLHDRHGWAWPSHELYNQYPALAPLYTRFEKLYDKDQAELGFRLLKQLSPWFPLGACALYLIMCYFGTRIMAHRQPYDLKTALMLWNAALALFSFCGAVRLVPHVINLVAREGFKYTITANGRDWAGGGAFAFWLQMFVFSKVPELGDTVFIILRKRPLIFLHWYHHVTVLLYTWHSGYHEESYGAYFAAMNYTVHSVMYLYYALACLKIRLCPPIWITVLQISQMFGGMAVACSYWYYYSQGSTQGMHQGNLWAGVAIYASYAILFLQYAIRRFIRSVIRHDSTIISAKAAKQQQGSNGFHHSSTNSHANASGHNGHAKPLKAA